MSNFYPIVPTTVVNNVAGLYAALSAASAGDWIHMLPGTYTLTAGAGGALEPKSGIKLTGAGQSQTIITEDGSIAGPLILFDATTVGTYGIAAIAVWAKAGVTDAAGDAANISEGDVLHIIDGAGAEGLISIADSDGVGGTGAFAFQHPVPNALNATSTVVVYTNVIADVHLEGFHVQGDGANTTYCIESVALVNSTIKDVTVSQAITGGMFIWRAVRCHFDILCTKCPIVGWSTRCTDCDTRYSDYAQSGGANNHNNAMSNYNRIWSLHGATACTTWEARFDTSHRNFIWATNATTAGSVALFTSDENVVRWCARSAVNNAGTGNNIQGT